MSTFSQKRFVCDAPRCEKITEIPSHHNWITIIIDCTSEDDIVGDGDNKHACSVECAVSIIERWGEEQEGVKNYREEMTQVSGATRPPTEDCDECGKYVKTVDVCIKCDKRV